MSRHGRGPRPRHDHGEPATRRWGACDTMLGRPRHDAGVLATRPLWLATRPCARAPGCVSAHLGVLAGSAGCALGAPSLFLDSVLFMSHCLDTVHEQCSSQIFLEKNNN